jgi:hypothetical protein
MKVNSFMEVLGLTVVAVIVLDIVTSRNSAQIVTSSGNAWSNILKSASGR